MPLKTFKPNQIPIFKNLSFLERKVLLQNFRYQKLTPGEILFDLGEPRTFFYIVAHGRIDLFKKSSRDNQCIYSFFKGDFLSESSLLNPKSSHTMKAVASGETEVLCLDFKSFSKIGDSNPAITQKVLSYIAANLTERLEHADNKLLTLYQTGQIIGSISDQVEAATELLDTIFEVISAGRGFLGFSGPDQKIKILATKGFSSKKDPQTKSLSPESEPFLKEVFKQKKATIFFKQFCNQVNKQEISLFCPFDSAIAVPVFNQNSPRMIIALFDKAGEDFNVNNKILLELIAHQLSASILLRESLLEKKAREELRRVYY